MYEWSTNMYPYSKPTEIFANYEIFKYSSGLGKHWRYECVCKQGKAIAISRAECWASIVFDTIRDAQLPPPTSRFPFRLVSKRKRKLHLCLWWCVCGTSRWMHFAPSCLLFVDFQLPRNTFNPHPNALHCLAISNRFSILYIFFQFLDLKLQHIFHICSIREYI